MRAKYLFDLSGFRGGLERGAAAWRAGTGALEAAAVGVSVAATAGEGRSVDTARCYSTERGESVIVDVVVVFAQEFIGTPASRALELRVGQPADFEEPPPPTCTPHNHRTSTAAAPRHLIPYAITSSAMQAPTANPAAAAADRPPDRYVVRPAGVLADILGAAEIGEDELLLRLRELGLITYPSPLLVPLLEEWPDVLAVEVLTRLDPTDLVVFGQAARACRAAVVAFGVPQEEAASDEIDDEGTGGGPLLLRAQNFVGSVGRLAWGKERGCPWIASICAYAARGGQLEVLKWAWERRCPWDSRVCLFAVWGGHLELLQWARERGCKWDEYMCPAMLGGHLDVLTWAHEHGCPWDSRDCLFAAWGGHLEVLRWAREHSCPWDSRTCAFAALGGHLEVLKWAREHHCPWDSWTCTNAVENGHLDVLRWAREHGCPWTAATRDAAATKGYSDNLPLSV